MPNRLLKANEPGAIEQAAALLKEGHLVAFPTDTLYGLGANLSDPGAIDRLYQAKDRPAAKGIPVLLAGEDDLDRVTQDIPDLALLLIEKYWPGPLTLILRRRDDLPPNLAPGDNVAVRLPDNEIAQRFIRAAGGAVATSSANRSGEEPARTAGEVLNVLGSTVAAVLDGGPVEIGLASTIVDCTVSPPLILREGPVKAREILQAVVSPC